MDVKFAHLKAEPCPRTLIVCVIPLLVFVNFSYGNPIPLVYSILLVNWIVGCVSPFLRIGASKNPATVPKYLFYPTKHNSGQPIKRQIIK
jgi:hypothetical protein